MDTPPIIEFFDDEPIITPAKFHAGENINCHPQIKTAICAFLSESIEFDQQLLQPILKDCRLLYYVYGRSGKIPIFQYRDQCLIVLLTVGSPVAAGVVEELKYLGIENVIAYGTAGKLLPTIPDDAFVLIERAIRDEGTSYHYLAPSLYVNTDAALTVALEVMLKAHGPVVRGTTWTTDALFRETARRVAKRREQGAVTVEMECAGFAAACQRLGLRFAEFVFFSDSLAEPARWQMVGDFAQNDVRRSLKVTLLMALIHWSAKIKLPK